MITRFGQTIDDKRVPDGGLNRHDWKSLRRVFPVLGRVHDGQANSSLQDAEDVSRNT